MGKTKRPKLPRGMLYRGRQGNLIYGTFEDPDRHPVRVRRRMGEVDLGDISQHDIEFAVEKYRKLKLDWLRGDYDPWNPVKKSVSLAQVHEETNRYFQRQRPASLKARQTAFRSLCARLPAGADTPVRHVTAQHVREWLLGTPRSAHTIATYSRCVRQLFEIAVRKGWCDTNPAKAFQADYLTGSSLLERRSVQSKKNRPVSLADFRRIYERLDRPVLQAAFEVARATGLRRSELVFLNRGSVFFAGHASGYVQVRHWSRESSPYVRAGELRPESFVTKVARERDVLLSPRAALALRTEMERMPADDPMAPVFMRENRTRVPAPTLTNAFARCRQLAGLTDTSFHQLRDGYATDLADLAFSAFDIADQLGHSNINQTAAYVKQARRRLQADPVGKRAAVLAWHCPHLSETETRALASDPASISDFLFSPRAGLPA
ncbi:MAG: tyrosine-type recombinase/integrase [Bacteroidota bacterium]